MMPVTPKPGAAELQWSVGVERADATQCTYWITVTNLTSTPIAFEGRYAILS
jgi:glycyl-tRNA synthetase alpha subunit